MQIKIERKTRFIHEVFEIENQVLDCEPYQDGISATWCAIMSKTNKFNPIFRVPSGGRIEISVKE